jgi:hypothetical protein
MEISVPKPVGPRNGFQKAQAPANAVFLQSSAPDDAIISGQA